MPEINESGIQDFWQTKCSYYLKSGENQKILQQNSFYGYYPRIIGIDKVFQSNQELNKILLHEK